MKIDLSCPVELSALTIDKETQTASATFLNLSQKNITAMKYILILFDENGEEIAQTPAELEGIDLKARTQYVSVISAENAVSADIIFTEVTFEDETVFTPTGEFTEVTYDELSEKESKRFERAGISNAECYAKEESTYWLCICGRPNITSSEKCIRCRREKEEVLKDFSSEQSVALTVLNKEDEDILAYEKERAEKKEAFSKKLKKAGMVAGIIVVALLIVLFAFKLIVTKIGDSNAAKGNYEKAYSLYQMAGSGNVDKIADRIYGNTASNLGLGGIIAQDDKNIYYTNVLGSIYKQDKATGEKTALKDVQAQFLNASGGWLYYVNAEDNKIYKLSSDGQTCELVYDTEAYFLFTVANDVYFRAARIDTSTENLEAAAQAPVYVLKAGKAEPELVLDVDASAFSVYNGRIYYIDYNDNSVLKSAKLSGGGIRKLTENPVYAFEVKNNKVYYIDATVTEDSQTGMPKLSLETASLKGKHLETLIEDAMVTMFAVSDNTIYYIDYLTQGSLFKREAGAEASSIAESVYLANVSEDVIYYLSYDETFYLSNADKSGYDAVASLNRDSSSEENTSKQAPAEETVTEEAAEQ